MSRSFSVNDSKRLSDEHIKLKSAISAGAQQKELLREEIKKSTDSAVDEAVVDEFERLLPERFFPPRFSPAEPGLIYSPPALLLSANPSSSLP